MDDIQNDIAAIGRIEAIPTILEVVAQSTGMGFAAVARVTESRWVACAVLDNIHFGLLPGSELPASTTICSEIRALRREVIIDHVAEDPQFCSHPTPAKYGFQSYISVPIILPNGEVFGTLCAIDPQPRKLKGSVAVGMFRLFAQLIAFHLDANKQLSEARTALTSAGKSVAESRADLAASQADLFNAKSNSELREQFIAVLGHDLRNPLAGIEGGRRLLEKGNQDAKWARILRLMGESVARMSGLIDNLMDFARGRLGGGIGIERTSGQRIEPLLAQVINEIKVNNPDRVIETRFLLSQSIDVDPVRFAQMFSNLLGNAVTHGAEDQPIEIEASIAGSHFELAVTNQGEPIPPVVMERLFQPFYRGDVRPSMQGLGLGLYIASQIAQGHGGRLDVTSDKQQTRFTFRMPV